MTLFTCGALLTILYMSCIAVFGVFWQLFLSCKSSLTCGKKPLFTAKATIFSGNSFAMGSVLHYRPSDMISPTTFLIGQSTFLCNNKT